MKKQKSKQTPMLVVLQNDLQWNIMQVAIDHIIEHLAEVISDTKGREKQVIKKRYIEAMRIKAILKEKPSLPDILTFMDLLKIESALKELEKQCRSIKMKEEADKIKDITKKINKIQNKPGVEFYVAHNQLIF